MNKNRKKRKRSHQKCSECDYTSYSSRLGNVPARKLFKAPRDKDLRKKWEEALSISLGDLDCICEIHFKDEDMEMYFKTRMPNGTIHCIKRENKTLTQNAVPMKNCGNNNKRKKKPETNVLSAPQILGASNISILHGDHGVRDRADELRTPRLVNKMATDDSDNEQSDLTCVEESLMSLEKLDRASPDLWPEQTIDEVPGVNEFVAQNSPQTEPASWTSGLTADDINQLHQLGNLTMTGLIAEVKKLHDVAYQLGLEEAKEMTRGKYLNIFKHK